MTTEDKTREQLLNELAGLRKGSDDTQRIARLGSWAWNMTSDQVYWSDEMFRILGLSPGEITPNYDTAMGFIHPDDRAYVEKAVMLSIEKGELYHIENRIIRVDGSEAYVISSGEVQYDESNQPVRMAGTIQDITEREALMKSATNAKRLAEENAVLAEIGRIINSSLDIDEVYERFAQVARRLIPFDRLSIGTINTEDVTETIAYLSGIELMGMEQGAVTYLEGSMTWDVVKEQASMLAQGDSIDGILHRFPSTTMDFNAGLRSMLLVPLISRNEVIAVLRFCSTKEEAYTYRDLVLAESIGAQIAGAIANSQLHRIIESQGLEQRVLAEIGRIISSSLDIDEVYERFAKEVRTLIHFDRITIALVDVENNTLTHGYVSGGDVSGHQRGTIANLEESHVAEVIQQRTGIVIQEMSDELLIRYPGLKPLADAGLRSSVSVPLIFKGQIIGVLHLRSMKPNAYTERELLLAERVGSQIAGVIANAQVHEEELRQSQQLVERLVNKMPDMLYLYDLAEQKNIYSNEGFWKVLGYTPEEVQSMEADVNKNLVHPDDYASVMAHLGNLAEAADDEILEHEYRVKHATGEWRWLRSRDMVFARTADGLPGQYLGTATDITGRKRLDEQLIQSQKMAAVGQMAGGISHDFNNLLTAIMGFTELALMRSDRDSPSSDFLKQANIALERARILVQRLMFFSKQQVASPRVLSLNDLIFNIEKLLLRVIHENIEIVTLLASDLWNVKVDSGQMEQVLVNLAVNARDAMLEGGKFTISTANVTLDEGHSTQVAYIPAGDYVMLTASDTGVGMTEEVKARAFEPYFTTKEVGEGSGLGLSVGYGIITQSGGHIAIDSNVGHGTTVTIYLPRVEGNAAVLPIRGETGYLPTGIETILVVEDDPMVLRMTSIVLREQGYTVLEAINGVNALKVAQEHDGEPIRLLLTDVVMPLMGGSQLAENIREIYPDIKLLFTSGYNDDTVLRQITLEDKISFMQKPVTPTILARRVRETLDR